MSSLDKADYLQQQVEGLSPKPLINRDREIKCMEDGFYFTTKVGESFYRWSDIENITAYKADLMTYDDLRLDIDFEDVVLTLSEDVSGWSEFVQMLPKKLLGILVNWESTVIQTPFETNQTVIYTKGDSKGNGG